MRRYRICLFLIATFSTALRAAAPSPDATVAPDSASSNRPLQTAVDAAPANRSEPYIIEIRPGTYKGHLVIPKDKPFITFRGDEAGTTIITDNKNVFSLDSNGKKLTTPDSTTAVLQGHDFTAENITFENTAGNHGQALAAYITGDRSIFRNCHFLGWQDTLRPQKGRSYFDHCQITGHVDFIYGDGTAVFDQCLIHVLADGYITAASTPESSRFGLVFLHCKITAEPSVKKTYLGRPWRPYAAVAFLDTDLPAAILPEGWQNWGKAENEKTARYSEYNNTGPGAKPSARVPWSRQLSDKEAKAYTIENILAGQDKWNPATGDQK